VPADGISSGRTTGGDAVLAEASRSPSDAPGRRSDSSAADYQSVPDGADSAGRKELGQRLGRLPPGHPSSNYTTDGTPRPAVTRLSDAEPSDSDRADAKPAKIDAAETNAIETDTAPADMAQAGTEPLEDVRPLTDAEHAEHIADVRARLEQAHADGLATNEQYTLDPDGEQWTSDRDRVQGELIASLYDQAHEVPSDRHAIVAGGLAGAGKTTVLAEHAAIDRSQYLTINPDDIKKEMASRELVPNVDGLSRMEASDLVHEESSAIAKQLAYKALANGKNVIWDITMSSTDSTQRRIDDLRASGYKKIDGIFVDIPVEVSVGRADARFRSEHDQHRAGTGLGGRLVPSEVIRGQADPDWGSLNRRTFEEVKHHFDGWSHYDNSVDGQSPALIDGSAQQPAAGNYIQERAQ